MPDLPDAARSADCPAGLAPAAMSESAWALHPQVSLRPEPFGALLYHFGTRRLTFLKDPRLAAVVHALPGADSADDACRACGVPDRELPRFRAALAALADTGMLVPARKTAHA